MNQKKLISKISKAANKIHNTGLYGSASYMRVSKEFMDYFYTKSERRKEKINKIFND
jgi:hypothetical protein